MRDIKKVRETLFCYSFDVVGDERGEGTKVILRRQVWADTLANHGDKDSGEEAG